MTQTCLARYLLVEDAKVFSRVCMQECIDTIVQVCCAYRLFQSSRPDIHGYKSKSA